jgi:hypothetical protein
MARLFFLVMWLPVFQILYAENYGNPESAIIDVVPLKECSEKPVKYVKNDSLFVLKYEEGKGAFPVIKSKNRPEVAEKINLMLQYTYLQQIPGHYENDDPFSISNNDYKCGQTTFLGYEVSCFSENILKVDINIEQNYCTGVGFDNQTQTQHYDLLTGDKIDVEDLFSKDGLASIKLEVLNLLKSKLQQHLSKIKKKIIEKKYAKFENSKRLNDQLALYVDCKANMSLQAFSDNINFIFLKDGIKFTRRHCWENESGRSMDEYETPSCFIKYKEHILKMSAYGKYISGYSKTPSLSTNINGKILKGTIDGKHSIQGIFNGGNSDGSLSMSYWYDSLKIPISLDGSLKNDTLKLVENDFYSEVEHRWIPKADLRLKVGNQNIEGFWINYKTKQKLKFTLGR